jgi:hypothetical protein
MDGSDQVSTKCAMIGYREVGEPTHEVTSCTCAITRSYSTSNKRIYNYQALSTRVSATSKTPIVGRELFTNSHPIVVQLACCWLIFVRNSTLVNPLEAQHTASIYKVTLPTGRASLAAMCMLQALLA